MMFHLNSNTDHLYVDLNTLERHQLDLDSASNLFTPGFRFGIEVPIYH